MPTKIALSPSTAAGSLGVLHLKRLWSAVINEQRGNACHREGEEDLDRMLMNALGLGLHQTLQHLFMMTPTFAEFEAWIRATAGQPDPLRVDRFNAAITGQSYSEPVRHQLRAVDESEPVLTEEDLLFWEENGYVVLESAVSLMEAHEAEKAIWQTVHATPDEPESWYRARTDHGIMVELIQHPALEVNRRSARIHKAFAQIWGTADLWATADRCGFHPPQREDHPFPGLDLHWDIDFDKPIRFGTQGILYLTDTPPEQGALTVVPGFHKRLGNWLSGLEPGADPQQEDLHALGPVPIGGRQGDLVIWHQSLPHGSSPNLCERPRIVQYVNLLPNASLGEGEDAALGLGRAH